MPQFAVTAVGVDRSGLLAAVARVLHERGGNVEDSAMTIVGGHFAIVLLVEADDTPDELQAALARATDELGLKVSVTPVVGERSTTQATHLLSVYGTDRPGIVAEVTTALAAAGANITDVETQVLGADRTPTYAMVIELVGADDVALDTALAKACADLGVDYTLRSIEAGTD